MNNELQVLGFDGKDVRQVMIDDEPWFVGKDVAEVLGYKNTKDAVLNHVDNEDKMGSQVTTPSITDSLGREQYPIFINESGIYSMIWDASKQSRNPQMKEQAKKFKRWLTTEVLPDIRKHGAYMTEEVLLSPETLIRVATDLKNERALTAKLQEDAKVALIMEGSKESMGVSAFAKVLNKEYGIKIGEKKLYQWFRDNGWVCTTKRGDNYNLPTSKSLDFGYMEVKETLYTYQIVSNNKVSRTTMITPKGHNYFAKKLKSEYVSPAVAIGNNVNKYRLERGYSMNELARRSGLYVNNIFNYENGRTTPRLETIFKLSDALDVSIEQLTGEAHG